jgi:cyclic pyranopterin phosphate synthase
MIDIITYVISNKCNNNCIFCTRAFFRENSLEKSTKEAKSTLKKKRESSQNIILTEGEPTLRNDFFDILSYCKKLKFKRISIQTNGIIFADKGFTQKVVDIVGSNLDVCLSLHAHNSDLYKKLAQYDGFEEVLQGIKNLAKNDIKLRSNTVVMQYNYVHLSSIIDVLSDSGIIENELMLVHPRGSAWHNKKDVIPDINNISHYLKTAIKDGKKRGQKISLESFPFCTVGEDYCNYCIEKKFSKELVKRHRRLKTISERCYGCKYIKQCPGVWSAYLELQDFNFTPLK